MPLFAEAPRDAAAPRCRWLISLFLLAYAFTPAFDLLIFRRRR